jgi:hypothetical protein
MKRHFRENYYIVEEGVVTYDNPSAPYNKRKPITYRPNTTEELRKFRFSRLGQEGGQVDVDLLNALASAMTIDANNPDTRPDGDLPAGFTYLAQFIDHDLTLDKTAVEFGEDVTVAELIQGRSPSLDLDALYRRGHSTPRIASSMHRTASNSSLVRRSAPRWGIGTVSIFPVHLSGRTRPSAEPH